MTKQEFIKTRKYIKMDSVGYSYLKENTPHIVDDFEWSDKEWQDEVLGVYIYDKSYFIYVHKNNLYSTIIGRENFIEEDLTLVEKPLWEYVEFEYNAINS